MTDLRVNKVNPAFVELGGMAQGPSDGIPMATLYVLCPCGHRQRVFALSRGGHGGHRCKGCGAWVRSRLKEVLP